MYMSFDSNVIIIHIQPSLLQGRLYKSQYGICKIKYTGYIIQ